VRRLNSIDIIPADAARDNIEAQARFIRALNNFDMVRIYSKIHTNQLMRRHLWGYYLDVVDPFGKPSRPTVESAFILEFRFCLSQKIKIGTTNTLAQGKATKQRFCAVI
jgi:hypothetical protein